MYWIKPNLLLKFNTPYMYSFLMLDKNVKNFDMQSLALKCKYLVIISNYMKLASSITLAISALNC